MRTRNLILIVVLLAIWPMAARSQIISGNIVGYVNVAIPRGLALLCNPLDVDGTNNINRVMTNSTVPSGTQAYLWNVTNQSFSLPASFDTGTGGWLNPDFATLATNYLLPPGRGFVVSSPSSWLMTFVGIVKQGSLTNFIAGNNKFSLLGNIPPVSGQLGSSATSTIYFPGMDGADVFTFNTTNQSYSDAYTYFQNYGWFDPSHLVNTNGPSINIAQGFFVQNPGPSTNWIQTFTVPGTPNPPGIQPGVQQATPKINILAITGNQVSLQILKTGDANYDVQFSTNGSAWRAVAVNQTKSIWASTLPDPKQGYFRVVYH